jgi:hypothetical protein
MATPWFRSLWRGAPAAALLAFLCAFPALAQRTDVIRGRVVGPDSAALPGVTVTAVSLPDSTVKKAGTNDSGFYSITFTNAAGRYLVSVAVPGFAPSRKPASRQPADTGAIVVDFRLTFQAQAISGVRSQATRAKPTGSDIGSDFSPGSQVSFSQLSGGLSGDISGDLTAALSMIPGLTVIPDPNGGLPTISAFGLGGDQNTFTLNGMRFGGSQVPRGGVSLGVVTSSYDPSYGGFAGARASLRFRSGSNTIDRSLDLTFDDPNLQWTTPVASQLGSRYRQPIVSGTLSGPILWDKAFYSTSFQIQQRASNLVSLTSESPTSLAAVGINPDSVARLVSIVGPLGIPLRTSGIPGERTSTSGSLYSRFDYRPHLPPPGGNYTTEDQYYLTAGGSWRDNAGNVSGFALPAAGNETFHGDGMIEATASRYILGSVLNESNLAVNASSDRTTPYLDLPTASILVNSALGNSFVQAGGSAGAPTLQRRGSLEAKNETSWYTWDRIHRYKITVDAILDHYSTSQGISPGSFSYTSLADFAANQPAAFSRTLTGLTSSGQGLNGSLGISDTYQPYALEPQRRQLLIQYGLRVEANHFYDRPAFNPVVDSLFGLRTDHVPNTVAITPMAGFSRGFGSIDVLPGQPGFQRGSITGGIREYRNVLSTASIDPYTRATGLPSAVQQLSCIGGATPTPEWSTWVATPGAIPTQCADATGPSPLAQATPGVAVFDPHYAVSTSWRGNLGVSALLSNRVQGALNGTYGYNLNQGDAYDLNFNAVPQFTVADEDNRPVYVPPSSIVPATGGVAYTQSRLYAPFAHVTEGRSDLESITRQVAGNLVYSPFFFGGGSGSFWNVNVNYTFSDNTQQIRGFGSSTAGDPRDVTWSPNRFSARHQVGLTFFYSKPNWFQFSAQGVARSGLPYTPSVSGDINGDGYSNDRAFVFNPATAQDSTVAAGMKSLLASAPRAARSCLERQLGTIAGNASCTGPWSSSLNLRLSGDAYRLGFKNRGTVSIAVANVLGAVDQAVHGANHLQGWGQNPFANPSLLTVRGFDPLTNTFLYTVNPLFGSTSVRQATFRSPSVVSIDANIYVGPDRESQGIASLLRPTALDSTQVLNERQIKARLTRVLNFPLEQLVQRKDSIKLTQPQVDSLNAWNLRYRTVRDSTYGVLAKYLAARHGDFGGEEVRAHWHDAVVAVYLELFGQMQRGMASLTPEQRARLPFNYSIQYALTPEELRLALRNPVQFAP